jgi:hypothetical protein
MLICFVAQGAGAATQSRAPEGNCFWSTPLAIDTHNVAYPDTYATYWYSSFQLPAGATVSLRANYPHARYMSLNSYSTTPQKKGVPSDAVHDAQVLPDAGSKNPFLAGASRSAGKRSWTVTVNGDTAPAAGQPRKPNTLYAGTGSPGPAQPVELIYRVYVPDQDRDLAGDGGIPRPEVVLADGRHLQGQAACDALLVNTNPPAPDTLPVAAFDKLIHLPGSQPTSPATDPAKWYVSMNQCTLQFPFFVAAGLPLPSCPPVKAVGQWSNIDNAYVTATVDRRLGPSADGHDIVVLRGRMPTTPRTHRRDSVMEGGTQLRYWSLCQMESMVTTRTVDCVYDEQVPLDNGGFYTIVVSTPEDRPANATSRCGTAWLDWGKDGDGAGRPTYGLLMIRNMLPDPAFAEAIQNVSAPDAAARVMGPYLASAAYMRKSQFEEEGCRPPKRPPTSDR